MVIKFLSFLQLSFLILGLWYVSKRCLSYNRYWVNNSLMVIQNCELWDLLVLPFYTRLSLYWYMLKKLLTWNHFSQTALPPLNFNFIFSIYFGLCWGYTVAFTNYIFFNLTELSFSWFLSTYTLYLIEVWCIMCLSYFSILLYQNIQELSCSNN
jgi:hypothetical protein